ncbi:PREDICTED: uncharacterized protein K02A2.6-like [Vollenhovia emeryi]|uniref:uncharacterized protein K02A2.6-like n=1 Tax=Vollenhovia emeryi TaxID=411798 RepID=UPI0005F47C85|nr:PREDICTED: uncharacterized protein K02A2.6-like [Vollenhovia emeryi]
MWAAAEYRATPYSALPYGPILGEWSAPALHPPARRGPTSGPKHGTICGGTTVPVPADTARDPLFGFSGSAPFSRLLRQAGDTPGLFGSGTRTPMFRTTRTTWNNLKKVRFAKSRVPDVVIASVENELRRESQSFAVETAGMLPVKFRDIQKATGNCKVLGKVTGYVMNGWPKSRKFITDLEVSKFFDQREALILIDGCIFFGDRIVIPAQFRSKILEELHRGHPGIVRMKLLARSKVFWPLIDKDIERTVKSCEDCAKAGKTPIKCSLQPWSVPSGPWSRIHIDYAGSMNGNYFLIMVDAYSKWPEVVRTNVTTTSRTIELILQAFAQHGHCDIIVSNNGPQFASMEFERFCKSLGVEHIRTAPYHPQSNGQAEKFVHLLKTGLKKSKGNIDQKLLEFLSCYRSTPSYGLGMKTPAEVLNGRTMKTRLDVLNPSGPHQGLADSKMAQQFNGHHGAKWKEFVERDGVYYQLHRSNDS